MNARGGTRDAGCANGGERRKQRAESREQRAESGTQRGFVAIVLAAVLASACASAGTPSMPAAAAFDRTKPPELAPPPSLTLPPVVTRTLPNGLEVVVVEHHELPVADFALVVRTGGEADPADRAGLATLTAALLDEGTTTRTALQIADQEAYLGARLRSTSGWDGSIISLHVPTAQMDSALALFADVALHPAFRAADLERLRAERLTDLLQLEDRGPAIANRAYDAILFGANDPYGHALEGTEVSTKAITRDDVQRFYATYFRPNNATLIVVGDVRADDIERRALERFGAWQRAAVPPVSFGEPAAAHPTTIYLIDKPGAPQSSVRIGAIGVARATPDYFPLLVMNSILGGPFTSRLNQNLRETHGYTYGAFSSFSMRRAAGPFTALAEVVASKTDSSLMQFTTELTAIRDTVPTPELVKAKHYLELQLPARFETTSGIANQLVPLVLYDLPLDFYNTYTQHIERVTQHDVQRVAERYIDPAHLTIVVVGDRSRIEPGIARAHLGPIVLRDLAGAPIQP